MAMKEIPMGDDELDSLMAELEAETAGMVKTPVAAPAPEPEPAVEQEPEPEPEAKPEPEPVKEAPKPAERRVLAGETKSALTVVQPAPWESEVVEPAKPDVPKTGAPAPKAPPELQFYVDVNEFKRDTAVSDINLDKCMIEQNGLRAYYGANAARAEAQADRTKLQVEIAEAKLYDKHRKALADDPTIKVTEKMVENAVRLDPAYAKIKNRLIEADSIASISKHLVESLKDRRDMIIQLGADRRDEGRGQARVLADQQERADLRERALKAAS